MNWQDYLAAHRELFETQLLDFLRIPSISALPAHAGAVREAGAWVAARLAAAGMENIETLETGGHPVVYADWVHAPGKPTIMIYGHFDTQPVDPLDLWHDDPFDPKVKTGEKGSKIITGRGSSDDKGQLMTFVEACRAYKTVHGKLPCKVTILFEGEEESGSPSLKPFLEANAEELKADFALVCDTGMWNRDTPSICVGLRGLVGEEITVKAADRDLHSGLYGGAAANPIRILAKVLAEDRVVGLQVPEADHKAFQSFLDTLGYPYVEETDNPVYRLFLRS